MRIAFLVNAFPVPSETFIAAQVEGLLRRGHDVQVYGSRPSGAAGDLSADLRARVHHFAHRPRSLPARVARVAAALTRHIGPQFRSLLRSLDPTRFGRAALALEVLADVEPFLRARPYDVLSCHFGPNGIRGVVVREVLGGSFPVVTAFHGYDLSAFRGRGFPPGYGRLFREGDLFLPVSEHWRDLLIQIGCPPGRTRVHHMGVDLQRFRFEERSLSPGEPLRVVSTARLVEKKGIEFGIRALERVVAAGQPIRYDILGDGPLRSELERLIAERALGSNVQLHGWAAAESVVDLMRKAHVFLAPSVTASDGDKEGIPVAIMEAMASGLPVVSTEHSGIPELVRAGETGLLAAERDPESLARALLDLRNTPALLGRMGRAGRAVIERSFDNEALNDHLATMFEELVAGRL